MFSGAWTGPGGRCRCRGTPSPTSGGGGRRGGDTFVVDVGGHRLLCVFSAQGVRSLYGFAEDEASFGLATYELIRRKVPDELFAGRRNTPHDLFGRQETERYLGSLEEAVAIEIDALGRDGHFEIFAESRRLGHRLGLGSWAGVEAASPSYMARLVPLFDRLDGSEAFVRPARTLLTAATGKVLERRAMHGIEAVVAEIWAQRQRHNVERDDFLAQLYRSFDDLPPVRRHVEVARDLILIHMGSQSNLHAASAWTLVNLLLHPEVMARVRGGEDGALEASAYESIRMAQRSITLRQVLRPRRARRRDPDLPRRSRGHDRHDALGHQHLGGARARHHRPRALPGEASGAVGGAPGQGGGEHLRPWHPLLPRPALRRLGHRDCRPGPARTLRPRTPFRRRPPAGPSDRRVARAARPCVVRYRVRG
ncbi:MAG TPA: hypothetical protein VN816_00740 [Acidimicrobiales bacterium]|nr:hypothetical protein [Acidimicrobiales bacterium]